jgi:hypothetical protein
MCESISKRALLIDLCLLNILKKTLNNKQTLKYRDK